MALLTPGCGPLGSWIAAFATLYRTTRVPRVSIEAHGPNTDHLFLSLRAAMRPRCPRRSRPALPFPRAGRDEPAYRALPACVALLPRLCGHAPISLVTLWREAPTAPRTRG